MKQPALPGMSHSLWLPERDLTYPSLSDDQRADVVVVGAGIAGLTTAVLLARAGLAVTVLEGGLIGDGTTGHTTAKISALQGTTYRTLSQEHGADVASRYAAAQRCGLDWIATYVDEHEVDCNFERRPAVTYAVSAGAESEVRQEAEAAVAAGLPVEVIADAGLPFATAAAAMLSDQAQFDPFPYLRALAAEVAATAGCAVHEHSRVVRLHDDRWHRVATGSGSVRADHVVVTTLLPVTDQGLFFARAEPKRSYCIAVTLDGAAPRGMYLSADSPTRSLRTARRNAQQDSSEVLIVGGGGHVTGRRSPTSDEYKTLVTWAREHLPVRDIVARWSAQDYVPVDHLPLVGPARPGIAHPLVATGFSKWGMTNGTAAALALADRILDRTDGPAAQWLETFDPGRISARGALGTARINAGVAAHMAGGWLNPRSATEPGEVTARRSRRGLRPVGTADTGAGPESVSLVCTHLGGICNWNDAERTWDCPLHGSRFATDGQVVNAPATRPLHRFDQSTGK